MGILELAIAAFIISAIAGALGLTNISAGAARVAKVLFAVFLGIALVLILLFILGISALT